MGRWIGLLSDKLNLIGGAISGISILIIGLIVTYEVIMRYVFRAPTTWVLEISIYLCIASVFLGGGFALREKAHIDVDVVTRRFPSRNQKLLRIMGLILTFIYCFVLTWKGGEMALTSLIQREVSPTVLNVPVVIPHSLVPIGGALLLIELIRQILAGISELRNMSRGETEKGNWVARNLPPLLFGVLIIVCSFMFFSRNLTPLGLTILIFVLIFGGTPIAFTLGLLGLMGFFFTFGGGAALNQVPMVAYKILDDFIIVAVP